MDTKRTYIFMLLAMMLMLGWQIVSTYEYSKHPEWKQPGNTAQTSTPAPLISQPVGAVAISSGPTTQAISAIGGASASESVLGSDSFSDKQFALGVSLSSKGAAVESVVLNQFRSEAGSDDLFHFQRPYPLSDGDKYRTLGVYSVMVDGVWSQDPLSRAWTCNGPTLELWDKEWRTKGPVVGADSATQEFDLDIALNDVPAVTLAETITVNRVDKGTRDDGGYELLVTYSARNLSNQPHTVRLEINGPTVPRALTTRDIPSVVEGYDDNPAVVMNPDPPSRLSTVGAIKDLSTSSKGQSLLWYGSSSNYFCAIIRPENPHEFAQTTAAGLGQDPDTKDGFVSLRATTRQEPKGGEPHDNDLLVPVGGAPVSVMTHVFFGPKQRKLLDGPYYSAFPIAYDKMLLMTGSSCSFLMWDWLVSALVFMLYAFHFVLRDWGLSIIALVCLVRLILHPITRRSQVSMMKMQKLAPEMERLKKKFGDDSKGYQQAQMELYKEMGFTPVLGCLPMFLQMPVFINLYGALLSTFELRQAPFLRFGWLHLTWIRDLSEPDNLIRFSSPITLPFVGWHVNGINVLPVLMAVVTFMNQKFLMPPPAVQTAEQEQQRKMMTYTSLLFPLMFYAVPSGLNLYYLTSTGLGIVESWSIRKHIKKRESMEKAGKEFVDVGKATRASRSKKFDSSQPVKKTGLGAWIADLQAKAEEMRRQGPPGKRKN